MTEQQRLAKTEIKILKAIERDLAKARSEGRFEDVVEYLDELVPHQKFSDDPKIRDRCASILRGEAVSALA